MVSFSVGAFPYSTYVVVLAIEDEGIFFHETYFFGNEINLLFFAAAKEDARLYFNSLSAFQF